MRPRYPLVCGRCGADVSERRGGQLRDDDYLELWHEHCEVAERLRQRTRDHAAASKQLFLAQTDADLWRHQAKLYRAQLVAAGVEPMDAAAEPEPAIVEEGCPV